MEDNKTPKTTETTENKPVKNEQKSAQEDKTPKTTETTENKPVKNGQKSVQDNKTPKTTENKPVKNMQKSVQEDKTPKTTETTENKVKNGHEAQRIFKLYPKISELFFTADGTPFFKKNDAQEHAKNLKNKDLKTEKR